MNDEPPKAVKFTIVIGETDEEYAARDETAKHAIHTELRERLKRMPVTPAMIAEELKGILAVDLDEEVIKIERSDDNPYEITVTMPDIHANFAARALIKAFRKAGKP